MLKEFNADLMREITLSKSLTEVDVKYIDFIQGKILEEAEKGFFVLSFSTNKAPEEVNMRNVLQHFRNCGFTVREYLSIGLNTTIEWNIE